MHTFPPHILKHDLPFNVTIAVAPRGLRDCGCTTRKGTQARSPKANTNPKPSCTMSIGVSTASCNITYSTFKWNIIQYCRNVMNSFRAQWYIRIVPPQIKLASSSEITLLPLLFSVDCSCGPSSSHLIPQSIRHVEQLEAVDQYHGQGGRVP